MSETLTIPELDIDPYAAENLIDPYPMHQRLREAGPVVRLTPYANVVVCARHAEVHAVFNDHATFISGAGVGLTNFNTETPFRPKSQILEVDPPLHTQTRTVLSRILSPKVVMQIRATFTAEAEALVERCVEKSTSQGQIDGIHDLAQPYPLKVFPDAVGLEDDGRENLLIYGDMIFNSMGPRNELLAKSAARVHEVTQWIMEHCQRENLRPGGFGDQIYQAADAGEISAELAPLLVRSFLSAGVDTTINGIGNALFSLAHHPDAVREAACRPRRWPAPPSRRPCAGNPRCRPSSAPLPTTPRSPACRSARTPRCCACWHRPTATRASGPTPSATTSNGGPAATWPWAPASTAAWARRSRGSKAKWC